MIDLTKQKAEIKHQESRKISNVALIDFAVMHEIIDRAIAAEAKLAEIEKQEPVAQIIKTVDGFNIAIEQASAKGLDLLAQGAYVYASPVQQSPAVGNEWHPIETAPKNKAILLDIGFPWPVFGIFNTLNDEFSYADMQAENFENATDIYFQTDYEKNPVAWMLLPEVAKKLQTNNNVCSHTTQGVSNAQE